jgi:hypothetical protein
MAISSVSGQTTIRFTTSDTINVFAVESSYWPFDTTWVAPIAYDLGSDSPYPFSVEVYRDSSWQLILNRVIAYPDSVIELQFYPDEQVKIRNLSANGSSRAWLAAESYHPNGQLRSSHRLDYDSLQQITTYYPDGSREREIWWWSGRLFNKWTEWYENGQVKLEAHYEPGPLTEEIRQRPCCESPPMGEWRYYKETGEIEKIEYYEEGVLIKTRTE